MSSSVSKISSEIFVILKQFEKYILNCQQLDYLKEESENTIQYLKEYYDFLNVNFFPELKYLEESKKINCFDNIISCSFRVPRNFKNILTLNSALNELERLCNSLSDLLSHYEYFKLAQLIYHYTFVFVYRIGSLIQVTSY